jgi:threonine dehydrogenase-like Zn-dependent dehydrogenase
VLGSVCGSDLWPYKSQPYTDNPRHMGHEFLGVVEETGSEVTGIILMGANLQRTALGRAFGATDVVAERGQDGIAAVRDLTGGTGTDRVLECVGLKDALIQATGAVRDGGVISRVGAPQYPEAPLGFGEFLRNLTLTGGVAPARAYMEELMPRILNGDIHPGRVFDRTVALEDVAEGYRLMNDREALKVLVRP